MFIPKENLGGAVSGDLVTAAVAPSPFALNSFVGRVVSVSKKAAAKTVQLMGVLALDKAGNGIVSNSEANVTAIVESSEIARFNEGQKAREKESKLEGVEASSSGNRFALAVVEAGDLVLIDAEALADHHPFRHSAPYLGCD